jgi:hypothetical protein
MCDIWINVLLHTSALVGTITHSELNTMYGQTVNMPSLLYLILEINWMTIKVIDLL